MVRFVAPVQRDDGRADLLVSLDARQRVPTNLASSGISFGYFKMMSPQNIMRFAARGNFAVDLLQEIQIDAAFAFGARKVFCSGRGPDPRFRRSRR